jgi:hypothetical protein
MTGVKIHEKTKDYAKEEGLFVLEPSGDNSKEIEVPIKRVVVW